MEKKDVFRWYFHTSKAKNETKAAVAAALDNDAPILLMVCKPNCAVCQRVWQGMKAETDFADYMKEKGIVGLKIEDTASHFTDLAKAKNKYVGIGGISGRKVNSTAPFFILFVPAEGARGKSRITLDEKQVELYIGGFGSAKASAKSYEALTSWLDALTSLC